MGTKIKILHIQQSISFGGVERTRLSLAKHLNRSLFEQKLICTSHRGDLITEIRDEGVEVFEIGNLKSPFQWSQHKKVQKIIETYKPDIIHGAVFEGVTMAAINGWKKNVPVIIIEETSDPKNRSWKGNLLMKIFSKLAHRVIGVSQGVTEEYLEGKLNVLPTKVVLINNGVALPRIVEEFELQKAKKSLGINEHDFIIGSTGRMLMDSHKRFSDLIQSFAKFALGKNNVKLLLVGDGPEKAHYESLVKELNVKEKVIFTGYQSDVTLYYKIMNVFSLVSSREAFGLVLAEAMLNQLPVVATKVGGMKYIVDDGKTGFLVNPYEIDEIADKFEKLYNDKEICQFFGDNGLQKALSEYTEESYTKRIEKLYLDLKKEIK